MPRSFRIAYLAHSLRSDWNNGNAHFLRGLLSELGKLGHTVQVFEPAGSWSSENLLGEPHGEASLRHFSEVYPDLRIALYQEDRTGDGEHWRKALEGMDFVVLHEWNPPQLALTLLALRAALGFRLLFHDTHHRASSSPESIAQFGIDRFDGVLAFGESLRRIYRERLNISRVWTLHEAADTRVFHTLPGIAKTEDVVWVGNWGDDERTAEIQTYLLQPAAAMPDRRVSIYGVRYPDSGLDALRAAGVRYGGYLPNLSAPEVYASARLTVHIPRQQYTAAMTGIPTIRVFEALACRIPLISAPWPDTEHLFREGDFLSVANAEQMRNAMEYLLKDQAAAEAQASRGLETVLARHTCMHRARELTTIFEEFLS